MCSYGLQAQAQMPIKMGTPKEMSLMDWLHWLLIWIVVSLFAIIVILIASINSYVRDKTDLARQEAQKALLLLSQTVTWIRHDGERLIGKMMTSPELSHEERRRLFLQKVEYYLEERKAWSDRPGEYGQS